MPSISTSTTSSCCKNRLGFIKTPTPDGVPVIIAVYAGIVVPNIKLNLAKIKRFNVGSGMLETKNFFKARNDDHDNHRVGRGSLL